MALVYFALGRKAESTSALSDLKKRFAEIDAADVAYVHAYRGEIDEAFEWLDRACLNHDSGLLDVKSNWLLTRLHGDPR